MSHTRSRAFGAVICAAILMALAAPTSAEAQGFLNRLKNKAKEKAAEQQDKAAEAVVNKAAGAIGCVVTDVACIQKAQAEGKPVAVTDAQGHPVSSADSSAALVTASGGATAKPGEGAWVNYDFVPGDRAIFVDDLTADNVGDFPRRFTFKKGNMEVAEWNGGRWIRATSDRSSFAIPLPETLPDRFTLEFDYAGGDASAANFLNVHFGGEDAEVQYLTFSPPGNEPPEAGLLSARAERVAVTEIEGPAATVRHASIMVDGQYAKVYVGSQRVTNVPNTTLGRSKAITFKFFVVSPEKPGFIGNIRVAAGGKDLYDALAKDGRVATHGILFDVGSATIRPESTPTLEEIGRMLDQHADLELAIEGHTDNTGSAAANQTLSEQRAAAVKAYLVATYRVDAARLTAKGFGASKPVASNDTPEGRQQNRRVELVKM